MKRTISPDVGIASGEDEYAPPPVAVGVLAEDVLRHALEHFGAVEFVGQEG